MKSTQLPAMPIENRDTPRGDGNEAVFDVFNILHFIENRDTPRGDGNEARLSFPYLPCLPLKIEIPREGTETNVDCVTRCKLIIENRDTPRGDGN